MDSYKGPISVWCFGIITVILMYIYHTELNSASFTLGVIIVCFSAFMGTAGFMSVEDKEEVKEHTS